MKQVYFIRHGQTDGNAGKIQLGYQAALTNLSVRQCELVADKFKNVKLDHILSSDYPRAIDSAKIINNYHNLELEVDSCFGGEKKTKYNVWSGKR